MQINSCNIIRNQIFFSNSIITAIEMQHFAQPQVCQWRTARQGWQDWELRGPQVAWQTHAGNEGCLLYTSPSPRDSWASRMPSSAWKKKQYIYNVSIYHKKFRILRILFFLSSWSNIFFFFVNLLPDINIQLSMYG